MRNKKPTTPGEPGVGDSSEKADTPRLVRRRILTGAAAVVGATATGQVMAESPAAAAAPDDRSVTPAKFALSAVDPAPQVPGARTLGNGPQQAASGSVVANLRSRDLDPHEFGSIAANGTGAKAAILAAMAAAKTRGGGGSIHLRPNQRYDVGTGLSLAGYATGIVGQGTGYGGASTGTVIVATQQTGAVLDLTGFLYPSQQLGKVQFGGFALEGSGAPGRARVGFAVGRTTQGSYAWSGGVHIHDIVVTKTGGACLVLDRLYLSEITNVILVEPVSVVANDVPYMISRGSNNNMFSRIGLRAMSREANVGRSGAVIITSSPQGSDKPLDSHSNILDSWWYENTRLTEGSTLLHVDGFGNVIRDFTWADCEQVTTATNTSHIRLAPWLQETVNPVPGGNSVAGLIPGRGNETRMIRWGVDVHTPYNRIVGMKGWRGYNVHLQKGVHSTHVDLGGSISNADGPGIVDDSGYVSAWDAHMTPNRSSDPSFGQRGLGLAGDGPLPEPIPRLRGRLWLVKPDGNQADELYLCMRQATGQYEWRKLS